MPNPRSAIQMLQGPETFHGDVTVSLTENAIAHVFVRDKLIQFHDAPGLRTWNEYQAFGFEAGASSRARSV